MDTWIADTEPSERFPLYTRANADEVGPSLRFATAQVERTSSGGGGGGTTISGTNIPAA